MSPRRSFGILAAVNGVVSARLVRLILGACGTLGGDPARLAAAAGIGLADVADDEARFSQAALLTLWREGALATNDDAFGLHVAEFMQHHTPGNVLAYAVHSSATLGEALRRGMRYAHLIHGAMELQLSADEAARLAVSNRHPLGTNRHGIECALLTSVFLGRKGTAQPFALRHVAFRHAAPASTAEHERLFAAPLRFNADVDEIVFERALLEAPMLRADPELGKRLERVLDELAERVGDRGFLGRVCRVVAAELDSGVPTVEDVAARLGMSTRSLQRRLQDDCGTSYQALVNELRRDLSLRYLGDPAITIAEVTFLVGFTEVSAFHRAFRRWTGQTPSEYRSQQQRAV
jgi:AraC-like DNA-binding protein